MKPWERDWRAAGQPVAAPPAAAPKPWERDWRSTAEPAAAATAAVQPTAEADGGSIADLLGAAGARTYQTVGGAARDFAQNTYDFSADILNTPAYLYEAMVGAEEPLYRTGGLELPEIEQPPDLLNQLVRGTGTVGLGMLAPGAALKTATQLVPTARGLISGLIADLTATDPDDPNLSNMVEDATGVDLVTAKDPNDNPLVNRLRDAIEGGVVGGVADTLLSGIGRVLARRGRPPGQPVTVDDITPEVAEEIAADPDLRAVLEANGITSPKDPRVAQAEERLTARRQTEVDRSALPPEADMRQVRAEREAVELGDVDPAAASTVNATRQPPPDVIQQGQQRTAPTGETLTVTPGRATDPGTQAGFDANAGVLTRDQQLELLDRYGHVPETVEQQRTLYRTLEGERGRQQETDARGPMATTDDALSGGEAPYSPASRAQDGPRAQQPTDAELDATGAQRPYARTATGIGDRPFRTDDTSGLDPDQMRAAEDRARAQADDARRVTVEDLERQWAERARAREQSGAGRFQDAENRYQSKKAEGTFSNKAADPDGDGRFATDEFGFVASDKGGPVRYGTHRQAAQWIINHGHKRSPDQIFEIENHPSGKGFTVRERGRGEPPPDGGNRQAGAQPPEGTGPGVQPTRALPPPDQSTPRSEVAEPVAQDAPQSRPIREFVDEVRGVGGRKMAMDLGQVSQANADRVLRDTGIDISGARREIDNSAINHALKQHGSDTTEAKRGQAAITPEDFGKIPEIVERPDNVERIGQNRIGRELIRYSKRFNGHTYYVEEVRSARKVALQTLYKERTRTSDAATEGQPPTRTPETLPGSAREENIGAPADAGKADADAAATEAAEKLDTPGSTKFYSNPLDPQAFKDLFGPIFKDLFGWAGREFDTWADEVQALGKALKGSSALTPVRALGDVLKMLWYSNDGVLRSLAARHNVDGKPNPTITKIADMFFAPPGRRDSQGIGRTYGEAVETHAQSRLNALARILEPFRSMRRADAEQALMQIGRLIRSGKAVAGKSNIDNAAIAISKLLREELDYLRKAGVDVGDAGKNYLPRELDVPAIMADPLKFRAAAERLYRAEGASAQEARDLAEAWFARIREDDLGFRSDGNDFVQLAGAGTGTKFEKSRTFGKNAEKILADFYFQNPADILPAYFTRAARRAEWVRRMGANLEKWKEMMAELDATGGIEAKPDIVRAIQSATGTIPSPKTRGTRMLASFIRNWSALTFLTRATLSSLSEPVTVAIRTGNAGDAFNSYVLTIRDLLGQMKKGAGGKSVEDARDLAEDLGAIGRVGDDMIMQQRFGGQQDGKFAQWMMNQFFTRTGLHQFTEATRVASTRIGQVFLRRLAMDVVRNSRRVKSARFLLGELGVLDEQIDAFAKFVQDHDGFPDPDMLGEGVGEIYATALNRLLNQTIMRPKGIEKPLYANHPFGSLFYSLQSFLYSFQKNVLARVGHTTMQAVDPRNGFNALDRLRMAAPLAMFPISVVAQWGLTDLRDTILDDPAKTDEQKTRTPTEKLLLAVSRAGGLGMLDLPVNILTGLRYQKDPATTMIGPIFGSMSELLGSAVELSGDRNSPNTNTAERKLARNIYSTVVVPAMSAAFSTLPGGSGALIGAAGIQAGASPATRENMFVGPLAGPPNGGRSSGRRSGRQSSGRPDSGRSSGRGD